MRCRVVWFKSSQMVVGKSLFLYIPQIIIVRTDYPSEHNATQLVDTYSRVIWNEASHDCIQWFLTVRILRYDLGIFVSEIWKSLPRDGVLIVYVLCQNRVIESSSQSRRMHWTWGWVLRSNYLFVSVWTKNVIEDDAANIFIDLTIITALSVRSESRQSINRCVGDHLLQSFHNQLQYTWWLAYLVMAVTLVLIEVAGLLQTWLSTEVLSLFIVHSSKMRYCILRNWLILIMWPQ